MLRSPSFFPEMRVPSLDEIPEPLKPVLNKIRQEHYEELYEPEADGTVSLEDALSEVLDVFQYRGKTLCHLRYVWMALILAIVVEPIVEYSQPNNAFTREIINLMEEWIFSKMENGMIDENQIIKDKAIKHLENLISETIAGSNSGKISNLQIFYESIDVFKNALRVLEYSEAKEAILEILEDCLEGYAMIPGSYGRRDLFDWWLLEVVPASWYLTSKTLSVVEAVQHPEEIKLERANKLQNISVELGLLLQNSE